MKHKNFAFSLIELLVIVAILALLTALLLPAFARARDGSRRAPCASNLRQIALGIAQYAGDADGYFPLACPDTNNNGFCDAGDRGWASAVQPYLGSTQVLQCPSEPTAPSVNPAQSGYTDYFYNSQIGALSGPSVSQSQLVHSANIVLSGDGYGPDGVSIYAVNGGSGTPANSLPPYGAATRHGGGALYAFCDGHVKWLQPAALSGSNIAPTAGVATFGIF